MERHDRRVRKIVAQSRERLEDRVLAGRVPRVRLQHQCERCEPVATVVRERRAEIDEEAEAGGVERLARPHDDAGYELRAARVQPPRALELSLQQRAIERVLEVA